MSLANFFLPRDRNGNVGSLNKFTLGPRCVRDQYIVTKFGRNDDVDAAEDIWNGGSSYTGFPTAAIEALSVVSNDANDSVAGTGAQVVRVFYYNDKYEIESAPGEFLYVDIELDGITPVDSGVEMRRVWRTKVVRSGSGKTNAGLISGYWSVTTSVIFFSIPVGFSQTQISNFTIPAGWSGQLKNFIFTMNDNTANDGEVCFILTDFGTDTKRITIPGKVSTLKDYQQSFEAGVMMSEKTDIVARVLELTNANAIVTVAYEIHLIRN